MTARQLLEIDSSILEKNLMVTDDYLNITDDPLKLLSSSRENPEFKLVKPNPGFCVKFKVSKGEKVFINICHTEELPAPRDITEQQLAEIIQAEEISDFKIPMSIGDPHEEVDKSGGPVTAYDVAINSKFFTKIQDSKSFSFLFLMIAIEGIESKYNIELNNDYTILQNRKCLGNLQYHRIRQSQQEKPEVKRKCLIEEVPSGTTLASTQGAQLSARNKKTLQEGFPPSRDSFTGKTLGGKNLSKEASDDYRIIELDIEGKKFFVVEAYLPQIVSSQDLSLNVGEDRLLLSSKKGSILVDTFFKSNIKENECLSQFNTKCQVLTVIAPVA